MSETPNMPAATIKDDISKSRFPYCIVWTPLPPITWLFPFIGHIGIAYSNGVIRDFAGPYFVSEDNMAFGKPTRILRLNKNKINSTAANTSWDSAIYDASEIYKTRMHNICCDNCHSHVCTALDIMEYDGKSNWNMVKLCFWMFIFGEYVSFWRGVYTWLPFLVVVSIIACLTVFAT